MLFFSVLSSMHSLLFLLSMLAKALFAVFLSPEDASLRRGTESVSAVSPSVMEGKLT